MQVVKPLQEQLLSEDDDNSNTRKKGIFGKYAAAYMSTHTHVFWWTHIITTTCIYMILYVSASYIMALYFYIRKIVWLSIQVTF